MNYLLYSDRLDYLLRLIRKEDLKSPGQLCKKFGCSEKTVRRMIKHLRSKGFLIQYNRNARKYILIEKKRPA
jgi:DeoR/GlpR family transcriptional regulator of sugar metabolism